MKEGTLKSGKSGKTVTNRKQAIAIGLSEARAEGAKMPAAPKKKAATAKRKAAPKKKAAPAKRKTAARKTASRKKTVKAKKR